MYLFSGYNEKYPWLLRMSAPDSVQSVALVQLVDQDGHPHVQHRLWSVGHVLPFTYSFLLVEP